MGKGCLKYPCDGAGRLRLSRSRLVFESSHPSWVGILYLPEACLQRHAALATARCRGDGASARKSLCAQACVRMARCLALVLARRLKSLPKCGSLPWLSLSLSLCRAERVHR